MRWSSGQRYRTSNAEVNYAPFRLGPLAPILAGFSHCARGFYDARNISTAGPRPGKGTARGALNLLSQHTDRWTLHLLQRGRAERRANAFAVARASFLIPDVRAPVLSAFRSLSPGSARLSGLWPQRLAGPENIRVHVRSLRRDHESLHGSARAIAFHALHAGLRRPRRLSHGLGASGPDRGSNRSGRRFAQRRSGGELEAAAGFLGRSRCQRKYASRKSAVAGDDADAPCRERSRCGTL